MASVQTKAATPQAKDQASELESLLDRGIAMRPELLQMRMENETIMSECRVRPRDLGECKKKLADLLREFPEFAEDSIYRRPVGKDEDTGDQKYAEGLSIRAAEALAEAYGFNRVRGDATRVDADTVKVDATFTDFATGRIWQDGRLVSQVQKRKNGSTYRVDEPRFTDTVVGAAKSKAIREVICRSVSPALKAWFENECRKIMASLLTDEKVDEIVRGFERLGMSLEQLETLLGRPRAMGWTVTERVDAAAFYSALKNNETTVADLLSKSVAAEERRAEQKTLAARAAEMQAKQGAATNVPERGAS